MKEQEFLSTKLYLYYGAGDILLFSVAAMNKVFYLTYIVRQRVNAITLIFIDIKDLIDGAAFIGVGFDGRGDYSPESRKMSIVQRVCAGKAT